MLATILRYVFGTRCATLAAALNELTRKVDLIMATLDDIKTAVAAEQTVEASAITLLTSLHDQLAAALAANDPAALQAIVDSINTQASALAAAVTANTPASGATTTTSAGP